MCGHPTSRVRRHTTPHILTCWRDRGELQLALRPRLPPESLELACDPVDDGRSAKDAVLSWALSQIE